MVPLGQLGQVVLRRAQPVHDRASVGSEQATGGGQLDRTRAGEDQRHRGLRSNAATCWLTADCVIPRDPAAAWKDPCSSRAARARSPSALFISFTNGRVAIS